MTIRSRLAKIETTVERLNPTIKKRLIDRDEFDAWVQRLDRSFEIRRLRKGIDYTESDLLIGAEKLLRSCYNFGGFAFDINEIGIERSEIEFSGGGLNGSASRKHL